MQIFCGLTIFISENIIVENVGKIVLLFICNLKLALPFKNLKIVPIRRVQNSWKTQE